ncbi:MAG: hypothetical protein B7Y48_07635 [Methylophilales bacterium 28-44-11]|jgi:twinkle protein|nr:MAG: hypothetical protein B7Y48_07635 [Methylophilales bacterium 28-44-11]
MAGDLILDGAVEALPKRGISQETCDKWGYKVGKHKNGKTVHIASHIVDGQVVAQKLRFADKTFSVVGDKKQMGLYGKHLWRDGGLRVVITEGEIDALTVSQVQNNKWAVVSLPNGAQAAKKSILADLEWLDKFQEVVLMFDNDEAGQAAIEECVSIFTPGKCKVARLPLKDANEMLMANRGQEIISAIWDAKVYRPDGIVAGTDITLESLKDNPVVGYEIPYATLNERIKGIRKAEVILFTAGTGIGKSTIVREIGAHFIKAGLSLGNIFLEESYKKTAQGFIAIDLSVPLGVLRSNPESIPDAALSESLSRMVSNGNTYFYNHFGSLDSDVLISKMNYFATALNVDFILLDHISMVISGQESSKEGERKDIDILMTKLRSLVERTGVGVITIAHLSKASGTSHEEGGRVTLNDLRGSAALKQVPDTIVALERDQQSEDPNRTTVRVLKCREFGELGVAGELLYVQETGRLLDAPPFEAEEEGKF